MELASSSQQKYDIPCNLSPASKHQKIMLANKNQALGSYAM